MTSTSNNDGLFTHSRTKIARAKKHLSEFQQMADEYFASNPARWTVEVVKINSRMMMHCHLELDGMPEEAGAVIGDVIHNLRAALDLCACEMARVHSGNDKGVYFPFCEQEQDIDDTIKRRNFHRAGPEAVRLVKDLKPFKGGNIALRAVHDLDIADKHKAIMPVAMNTSSPAVRLGENGPYVLPEEECPSELTLIFPRDVPLADEPMLETLQGLIELVERIVDTFSGITPQ